MKFKKFLPILLIVLIALLSFLYIYAHIFFKPSSAGSTVADFPLTQGMTWTYSHIEYQPTQADPFKIIQAESTYTDTVVDTQTAGSFFIAHVKRTVRLVKADPGWISAGEVGVPEWWYVVEGSKVYEIRRQPDVDNIQADYMILDLDFPLSVGKSWCANTGVLKGGTGGSCASNVSVDRLEQVDTPAGEFDGCYQVTLWSNGGNVYQEFCPGVGFVSEKFDHSGTRFGFEQRLTDFSLGGSKTISTFQLIALILAVIWLALVVIRFRRSTLVLLMGLLAIGLFTLVEYLLGNVSAADLGLARPESWLITLLYALAGLAVMLAYSPVADWVAGRWFKQPPTLQAFKAVQHSWVSLAAGIVAAWVLGGILEELIARGIVLNSIEALLNPSLGAWAAAIIAILLAAAGAGSLHSYQGPRAMVIIAQLSVLFGVLFVLSGHNLWAVMICHGLYDTIAFIRFALRKSRYSRPESGEA